MNDIETTLRDALAARGAAVRTDPSAYEAVVARRSRRRLHRWSAASAGLIATITVVGVIALSGVTAPPPPTAPPTGPAGAEPKRFAAVVDGLPGVYLTRTGANVFGVSGDERSIGAVAAYGDGERFIVSSSAFGRCESTIRYVEEKDLSSTSGDVKGGSLVGGRITDMAVSPDGTRLAYVLDTDLPGGEGCGTTVLRVRDLRTGIERTWTDGMEGMDETFVKWLSWSPDSRHLAYNADICCDGAQGFRILDVTADTASFLVQPLRGASVPDPLGVGHCRLVAPAYRGTSGDLTAVRSCVRTEETFEVVVVDPATGKVLDSLFTLEGPAQVHKVEFDASGRRALVERGDGEKVTALQRWDGGSTAEDVGGEPRGYAGISW